METSSCVMPRADLWSSEDALQFQPTAQNLKRAQTSLMTRGH